MENTSENVFTNEEQDIIAQQGGRMLYAGSERTAHKFE